MKVRMLHDYILVRPDKTPRVSNPKAVGYISDDGNQTQTGVIVALGPGEPAVKRVMFAGDEVIAVANAKEHDGQDQSVVVGPGYEIGDVVGFSKYTSDTTYIDGVKHLVLEPKDVQYIIEEDGDN